MKLIVMGNRSALKKSKNQGLYSTKEKKIRVSGQTCLDLEGAQCMGKIEVTLRKQNHLINLPWFDVVPKNEHTVITLLTQQACCSL